MKFPIRKILTVALILNFFICSMLPVNAQATFQNKTTFKQQLTTTMVTSDLAPSSVSETGNKASAAALAKIDVKVVVSCYDSKIVVQVKPDGLPAGVATCTGTITITDAIKGIQVANNTITPMTLKPYITSTYTYYKTVSNTVQEDVVFNADLRLNGAWVNSVKAELPRYNFVGGAYNSIDAFGGNRHHCPADATKSYSGLTTGKGPVIRMLVADHYKTASYGGGQIIKDEIAWIQKGYFLKAQQLDINDIRSKFGNKYDYAIGQMVDYTKNTLGYKK